MTRTKVADAVAEPSAPAGRSELLVRFPPRPAQSSWPETAAPRTTMVNRLLSSPFALENRLSQLQGRRRGVLAVVAWLQARPGETWQERWRASGAETAADWRSLVDPSDGRARPSVTRPLGHLAPGLLVMICGDVIRPSLAFVLASAGTRRNLAPEMARTRDPKGFAALARSVDAADVGLQATQQALTRVACILAAKGGLVCDVTVGDCVELLELARQMRGEDEGRAGSPLFYQLLRRDRRSR